MAQPYVGEIRMFAGSFAPAGWQFCNGALLPISENETLFNLIGTTYGGDGQDTFAVPNLVGRLPLHRGTLSGTTYQIGELAGVETVTLNSQQIPIHSHPMLASSDDANSPNPGNNVLASAVTTTPYFNDTPTIPLQANSIAPQGESQPHENMQPYLCITFIISLFGIFPPPN
jgi:microcystin-dependent protein